MYNGSERVIQAEAQPRPGVTCLFSRDSRAACSLQSMPAPDLEACVQKASGTQINAVQMACHFCPLLALPGTDECGRHYRGSTPLAPPTELTPRDGCAP